MPRPRSLPRYRLHKSTGQAVVTLRISDGSRRDVYLGKFDSPESKSEYGRIIGELATVATQEVNLPKDRIRIVSILKSFLEHVKQHYRRSDGTATNEAVEFKLIIRLLNDGYGHTLASEFGPLALKALRKKLLTKKLSRTTINARCRRIKQVFKWAASEELVHESIYKALTTVSGLAKGRTTARESVPIQPVAPETVDATIPYLSRYVRAMVEVHRLCGCRPEDVCRLRLADIDQSDDVWVFEPEQHKNSFRGKVHKVWIGPKAQAILKEFMTEDPKEYFFNARKSAEEFRQEQSKNRKTPRFPSHMARNKAIRVKKPKRQPAECYNAHAYTVAIARAVRRANQDSKRVPNTPVPHWAPNQLRHAVATEIRKRFGLEAAQVILDHEKADVTQIYAEKNDALAKNVALVIG